MTNTTHVELLNLIRQFKKDDVSDLHAALNVIEAHAEEIKRLQGRVRGLEATLREIVNEIKVSMDDSFWFPGGKKW